MNASFTCPRCFHTSPIRREMKFCPHCGLEDAAIAAGDTAPMDVTIGRRHFQILDRLAVGSICAIYRCRFEERSRRVEGLFKIARDPVTNDLVSSEAAILRQLQLADDTRRFGAFLPSVVESFGMGDGSGTPRWANVLRMHEEIGSPDELYTLAELKSHYPTGLDARDVAWIWRRLLDIIGFLHSQDIVHAAVLPPHVLIEPREHKLLLVDFCASVREASQNRKPVVMINGGYDAWYKRQAATRTPPGGGLDVAFAARCAIDLLGGDPIAGDFPESLDPALVRYLQRCLASDAGAKVDAWKLLDDFDRLIETLWGPRKFRVLPLPPKKRS